MPVPSSRAAAVVVVLFLMSGCAGVAARRVGAPPPPRTSVATAQKVIYTVPKNAGVILSRSDMMTYGGRPGAVVHGVAFVVTEKRETSSAGYGEHTIEGIRFVSDKERTVLQVLKFTEYAIHTSSAAKWLAYTKYYVGIDAVEQADRVTITFTPREVETKKDGTLGKALRPPPFSEEELVDEMAKARVAFKVEVDSPYGKDAIIANFKRVLGAPLEEQEKSRSGANKTSFKLAKEKYTAYLSLETWPYRNGTKTIVTVDTTVWPATAEAGVTTIDVQRIIDQVKKDVEAVVNG